ncbi:MAG: serine/threonine-protein kinase [Limisphaerales bacterium]
MSESSPISSCPTCGATLPTNAPQGLCPKCLLLGVAAPTELDPASARSRPAPPSREAVAAAFPQLEVLELIGQGGMGCVFKARQPQLNRSVALKILPESLARDAAFATRFTREAQALAALSHPNIVTIHDFGQAGGFFYLLMEFVDGVNLRQALRGGRFTPEQALAVVPPLCDALQFAHERGIVHRDIKPENLLLDKGGRIKIADFGIARMLGSDESRPESATRRPDAGGNAPEGVTGDFAAGTPGYMAPEQKAASRLADSRADIYSLGVVLYEMLTGELPGARLQPPSRTVRIDVRLDEIVLRALEQTPELRYQTAAEFRARVETLVSNRTGAAASPVGNLMPPRVPAQAKPDWPRIMEQVATGGLVIVVGVPLIGILLDAVGYRKGIAFGGGELLLMLLLGGLCLLMRIAAKSILSTRNPVPTSLMASLPTTQGQVLRLVVGLLVGIAIAGAAAYLIVRFINTGWPRQATPEASGTSASQGIHFRPEHETQPGARDEWRIVEVSAANPWCRWALPRDVEAL